jgi:diguanylate cyclase (GGDEF)-like protein
LFSTFFIANQLIAETSRKGCNQSSHPDMRGGDMEHSQDNEFRGIIHMLAPDANAPMALDVTTLVISGTCITALLGLFLLSAWAQERIRALAWWGTAYLLGGFSVAVWSIENLISPPLPSGTANALLFLACGMIWSAARIFHGRPVLWGAMAAGAAVWLAACTIADFVQSAPGRIVLSSLIVSAYTFLTAAELWRERRKSVLRRWPAIFVPMLHGAVFLIPIPLASLLPADRGIVSLASGWIAVFALETMLYVVGTAFIILVLAKEHTLRVQRDAALTDELTGALNRRGFFAAAQQLVAQHAKNGEPVSVLMFDLDHFKSINDRFGHPIGDETLKLFAAITSSSMRSSDIFARFGGEEFVAMLPCSLADATVAAERVRVAFQAAAGMVAGCPLAATVSVGAVSAELCADVAALLTAADQALYRAKAKGRNRVENVEQELPVMLTRNPTIVRAGGDTMAWHVDARTAPAA